MKYLHSRYVHIPEGDELNQVKKGLDYLAALAPWITLISFGIDALSVFVTIAQVIEYDILLK